MATDYSLWPSPPAGVTAGNYDSGAIVGQEFDPLADLSCSAFKLYCPGAGMYVNSQIPAQLYEVISSTTGTPVAGGAVTFVSPGSPGWMIVALASALVLSASKRYRLGAAIPYGVDWPTVSAYFSTGAGAAGVTSGALFAPGTAGAIGNSQGTNRFSGGALSYPYGNSNSWQGLDLVVSDLAPAHSPAGDFHPYF